MVRYWITSIISLMFYIPVLAYHQFGTVPYNVWLTELSFYFKACGMGYSYVWPKLKNNRSVLALKIFGKISELKCEQIFGTVAR